MFKRKILFHNNYEVRKFVKEAEKCDFEIDISHNHIFIDAKSILGVIGFGLSKVLTVTYSDKNIAFEKVIRELEVA